MKQKFIIGFSLLMLVLAIFMIARDLFRQSSFTSLTACCNDEYTELKKFDPSLLGYNKIRTIETGLTGLTGLATDEEFTIFVAGDRLVAAFDTSGNRTGGFPTDTAAGCITVEAQHIYLGSGPAVIKYDYSGKRLIDFSPSGPGGYITSVAVRNGQVYAADALNKRVVGYDDNGTLIQEFGAKDSIKGAPGLVIPSMYFDVAFDGFGGLWMVNPGRLKIENYNSAGYMQMSWGIPSASNEGFTGCCNPAHIAILPNGSFVTYEKGIDKVKVFDATGTFVCMVAGAGSFRGDADFSLGNLNLVKDIAVDTQGNIYILDAFNRISIFRELNS